MNLKNRIIDALIAHMPSTLDVAADAILDVLQEREPVGTVGNACYATPGIQWAGSLPLSGTKLYATPVPPTEYAEVLALGAENEALRKAYMKMRNAAAGYSNYCEESASVKRCERDYEEAEAVYRLIPVAPKGEGDADPMTCGHSALDAALAQARAEERERIKQHILGGYFLHDAAPAKQFAREVAAMIDTMGRPS